jgi:glutaminyl-tRNA synthetase
MNNESSSNLAPDNGVETEKKNDFISDFIAEDLKNGRFHEVHTRFPPEPNGWLHIGHCKAFSIDFGMAEKFGGKCNLRFDDTNPAKEGRSFVEAIERDVRWLGYDWDKTTPHGGGEYFASDYYEYFYDCAVKIIKKGHAYVDDLTDEEISEYRGTAMGGAATDGTVITPPGRDSPWRNRSVEENLDLFARMRAGEFPDGAKTLRAKIDMAHPNLVMRDPVMYRIKRANHYRLGDQWCIYPMYDFAHPLEDAHEHITHSLCSLEFEIHRPLYDWFIREAEVFPSRQIEFARLNLTHTVLSKRYLAQLVNEGRVSGWDDPRMPTIAGLRRRGYTPEAIRDFISRIGVAKSDSTVDIALLEYCLREDLNKRANRVMAVLKPLKLVVDNWEEEGYRGQGSGDSSDTATPDPKPQTLNPAILDAINNPEDPSAGKRVIHFGRELWIERDDFAEVPPPKYFRLFPPQKDGRPGSSVRLRWGYIVTCVGFDKDADGIVTAVHCTYDAATRGGNAPDNRKVKGTIHWVNAADAVPIEVRDYDYLFLQDRPMEATEGKTWLDNLNPRSLVKNCEALAEPAVTNAAPGQQLQFERLGYFTRDIDTGADGRPVFNKTIGLRDTWKKISTGGAKKK